MAPSRRRTIDSLTNIVEELSCSLCLKTEHSILVLPCQHRFCKGCIDKRTVDGTSVIACPDCSQDVPVPAAGFPVCRFAEYFRKQMNTGPGVACRLKKAESKQICNRCDKDIEVRCNGCKIFLCYRCVVKTKCEPTFAAHQTSDLTDLAKEADQAIDQWKLGVNAELQMLRAELKDKELIALAAEDIINSEKDLAEKIVMIEQIVQKEIVCEDSNNNNNNNDKEESEDVFVNENTATIQIKEKEKIAAERNRNNERQAGKIKKALKQQLRSKGLRNFKSLDLTDDIVSELKSISSLSPATPVSPKSAASELEGEAGFGKYQTVSVNGETYKKAVTLYDFTATEEANVSSKTKDVLAVLDEGTDGWTEVIKIESGEKGFVPSNYILVVAKI